MRPLSPLSASLLASLLAFLLVPANAYAQTTPYPPANAAPLASVQVTAPVKHMRIRPAHAKQISGAYDMANGWWLRVFTSARHIDAVIDDQPPIRLVAIAPYRFVSGDGNVTMEFNRGTNGEDMRMTYVPDLQLGQRVVVDSALAHR